MLAYRPFAAVSPVDGVMIGVIGFGEGDVTLDAYGPDAALGAL